MIKKTSNKIIIPHLILISTLIITLIFFILNHVEQRHLEIIKKEMKEKLSFVELDFKKNLKIYQHLDSFLFLKDISEIISLRITLINSEGQVLADTEVKDLKKLDNHRYRPEIIKASQEGYGENIRYSQTLRTDLLYVCRKINDQLLLRLAKPLLEIKEGSAQLKNIILSAGFLAIIISSLIIILITNRITKPINETLIFAKDFTKGIFSKRILNYNGDELGNLQKSLNKLADTIEEKINYLILEQNKLKVTIESIKDGIAVIDNQKKILIMNKSFATMLEIENFNTENLYFEMVRDHSLNKAIEKNIGTEQATFFEAREINNRFCEILISPIKDKKTMQGIIVVIHDITDQKRVEIIKKDLVSNMSHELKTPLTILKGYLETMENNLSDPKNTKYFLEKALQNIDRQNSLINDILKLSRLETTNNFTEETINPKKIIENCLTLLEPKIKAKKIEVTLDLKEKVKVPGNHFLAEEIFFNLIDNAINYNHENGKITIKITTKAKTFSSQISNTANSPIPIESYDRIFERFYRVDNSRSRSSGGTGLGLAIVKHAADLLKWKVGLIKSDQSETIFQVTS